MKQYIAPGAIFILFAAISVIWLELARPHGSGGLYLMLYVAVAGLLLLTAFGSLEWMLFGNPPGSGGLIGPWLKQFSFPDKKNPSNKVKKE